MHDKSDQASFEPIHGAHAIVEAIVYVRVAPAFSSKDIHCIMDLQNALKEYLPKFDIVKRIESTFTKGQDGTLSNTVGSERNVGVELQRIKPDGTVEWILRTDENSISIHCLNYERWDIFINHVLTIFRVVKDKIKATESAVSLLGLKVVDNFLYHGQIESYKSDKLFKENEYLAKHFFNAKERWHSHAGWFEGREEDPDQYLNQLKIDALYKTVEGKKIPLTSIDHNVVVRFQDENLITLYALIESEGGSSLFVRHLTELHQINKKVLLSLLNSDMATRVNLQPTQ